MLPGLIRIVLCDRAVVMVVVCLAQRVHRHVRHAVRMRECRSLSSKGKGLPKNGEQHQGKGELAAAHDQILVCL